MLVDIDQLMANSALFRICIYLAVILIVCKVVLWFYNNRLERQINRSKGIPVENYTAEELAIIIRKNLVCPYVQEMGADEQGDMFFQCDDDRYYSRIINGRLYIVRKNRFGMHSVNFSEKGDELRQCVADIFSDNPENDREELAKKQRNFKRSTIADWIIGSACFLCILCIIFQMAKGMDILKSRGVSLVKFSNYSTEYTINDALRASCIDGKWSSSKEGDDTYAYFTGTTFGGSDLVMVFRMDADGNCEIISAQVDGENYSLFTGILLAAMYSNIENASQ